MSNSINVSLTAEQIDILRGVLFEYYSQNDPYDQREESIRQQLEIILADAENEIFS